MPTRSSSRLRTLVTGYDERTARPRSASLPSSEVVEEGAGLVQAPWRALCPPRVLELHDPDLRSLRRLPSGTSVALVSNGPLSRRRVRRHARLAGISVHRELMVLPSTSSPIVVLDDTAEAVRHFWTGVAAVPPGVTWAHAPASLVLTAVRRLPWRLTSLLAPGRVLVGVRR
jgi:hypothetical protein